MIDFFTESWTDPLVDSVSYQYREKIIMSTASVFMSPVGGGEPRWPPSACVWIMFLFPISRSVLCQSCAVTIFFWLFLRRSYRAHIARIGWDKVPPLRQWLVFDSDGNLIRVRLQKRYERSG